MSITNQREFIQLIINNNNTFRITFRIIHNLHIIIFYKFEVCWWLVYCQIRILNTSIAFASLFSSVLSRSLSFLMIFFLWILISCCVFMGTAGFRFCVSAEYMAFRLFSFMHSCSF